MGSRTQCWQQPFCIKREGGFKRVEPDVNRVMSRLRCSKESDKGSVSWIQSLLNPRRWSGVRPEGSIPTDSRSIRLLPACTQTSSDWDAAPSERWNTVHVVDMSAETPRSPHRHLLRSHCRLTFMSLCRLTRDDPACPPAKPRPRPLSPCWCHSPWLGVSWGRGVT